jgi:PAT family beta-lactamase induction signal transducer AmpG
VLTLCWSPQELAAANQAASHRNLSGWDRSNPRVDPWMTAHAAVIVAFLSASQDIVIDAYRIEYLPQDEQGHGAAATQVDIASAYCWRVLARSEWSDYRFVAHRLQRAQCGHGGSRVVTLFVPEPKVAAAAASAITSNGSRNLYRSIRRFHGTY